jgi:transposase-like protein
MNRRPDEHYAQVAEVVNEALDVGDTTGTAVASTWDVPLTTAYRWIKEAKKRGITISQVQHCPTCGAPRSRWLCRPLEFE